MSCQRGVYQWTEVVTTHLPPLSKPQAAVLALEWFADQFTLYPQ
jgi:hypothetical protein